MAAPLVVTPDEFAKMLGVSRTTIFRLVAANDEVLGVPALRVGSCLRFSRVQVERVVADQATPEAAPSNLLHGSRTVEERVAALEEVVTALSSEIAILKRAIL